MHLLTGLVVICTFVVQRSSCWVYNVDTVLKNVYNNIFKFNNDYDQKLDFKCPSRNQFISNVVSLHHNGAEDRRFALSCRDIISGVGDQGATCEHSGYVNNFDEIVDYVCPGNGYINGMESVHDNGPEDRRWNFYCCSIPGKSMSQCSLTGWTNDFDGFQNYHVPNDFIMTGVYSEHHNGNEDRRFRYRICRVG